MKKAFIYTATVTCILLLAMSSGAYAQQGDTPKFEVGAQFSSLSLSRPTPLFDCCIILPDDYRDPVQKAGFGGRFTYNLTNNIAVEAEGNFFPERGGSFLDQFGAVPGGKVIQGQFGVKAGKRFKEVGLFGKARPGFVRFTEVNQLVSTRSITFMDRQFTLGEFCVSGETYFSTDIGGVVEFYPSHNTVLRVDVGDTIIRYTTFRREGFSLSGAILARPPETTNNFQFSAGFGFRF